MEKFAVRVKMKSGDTHVFMSENKNMCYDIAEDLNRGYEFLLIDKHLLIKLDELESINMMPMLVAN